MHSEVAHFDTPTEVSLHARVCIEESDLTGSPPFVSTWPVRYPHGGCQSESHYDWQSVSQSVLVSYPIWGIWPQTCFSVLNLRKLQSCLCGRPLWWEVGSVFCYSQSLSQLSVCTYISKKKKKKCNVQQLKMVYIQYVQGLCQSRLSTADYALFLVAFATTAVLDTWTVVCLTAVKFKPLVFPVSGYLRST
jgi:hypothetical protein